MVTITGRIDALTKLRLCVVSFPEGANVLPMADWMIAVNHLGLRVPVPNLDISGDFLVMKMKDLICFMLRFNPAERCTISDVCRLIQKVQG